MRLTKIYTKVGDKGQTMLASGDFVSKADLRIEAYGTVDELNANMGFLRELVHREVLLPLADKVRIIDGITQVQNELFDLGAELSTPTEKINKTRQSLIQSDAIGRLESQIDAMNTKLEPLKNFVLPGGTLANAAAHMARTVCRRAERQTVRLGAEAKIREEAYIYLNRLSDWIFVLSRELSRCEGASEILWNQKRPGS